MWIRIPKRIASLLRRISYRVKVPFTRIFTVEDLFPKHDKKKKGSKTKGGPSVGTVGTVGTEEGLL